LPNINGRLPDKAFAHRAGEKVQNCNVVFNLVPKSKGELNTDFWHFPLSKQHADGTDGLARYD